jgi:hypothetical protein
MLLPVVQHPTLSDSHHLGQLRGGEVPQALSPAYRLRYYVY